MSEHVEIPSSEACLSSRVLSLHPVSCCSRAIVLMASDKIEGERAIPLPLKLVFDPILVVDVFLVTLTFFCDVFFTGAPSRNSKLIHIYPLFRCFWSFREKFELFVKCLQHQLHHLHRLHHRLLVALQPTQHLL